MRACSAFGASLALGALAHRRLGHPALGANLGGQLGPAHGIGALVGRLPAALHQPVGSAHGLSGLLDLAQGAPQRDVGLLTLGVGGDHALGGRVEARPGLGLGAHGSLGSRHQLRPAVAALEHALGPAGGRLAQFARARPPHAARGRDGDSIEVPGHGGEGVHDPRARKQRPRHGPCVSGRGHVIEQAHGTGTGRLTGRKPRLRAPATNTRPPSSPAESSAASPAATLSTTPAPNREPRAAASASS